MVNSSKLLIIDQYKDKKRVVSREEIKRLYFQNKQKEDFCFKVSLISLKSPAGSCGDEIEFLVLKENHKVKEIKFSNENCCIITASAANIASRYLEENSFDLENLDTFVCNVEKMVNGKSYEAKEIKEFSFFAGIENLYGRIDCLKIVINFVREVVR